jgi:type IV secretion system protein TrbL
MSAKTRPKRTVVPILGAITMVLVLLCGARGVVAQLPNPVTEPGTGGADNKPQPPGSGGGVSPIEWATGVTQNLVETPVQWIQENIIQHLLVFPTRTISEAIQYSFYAMLKAQVADIAPHLRDGLAMTFFATPRIVGGQSYGGIGVGAGEFMNTWKAMRKVAAVFWPVTLAVIGALIVSNNALAAGFGSDDAGSAVLQWFVVVLASGTSVYWCDWVNRLANALSWVFLGLHNTGSAFGPAYLVNVLFLNTVGIMAISSLGSVVLLFLSFFMAVIGFLILLSLILTWIARYALIFVLVSLAPLLILCELFPVTKWLSRLWIKGFVMVEMVLPINALLFSFAVILVKNGLGGGVGPFHVFIRFAAAVAVLSLLLTVNYAIIRFTWGGIATLVGQAKATVSGVVGMVTAAAGGLATAGLTVATAGAGAGALPAAGAGAAAGAGSGASGAAGALGSAGKASAALPGATGQGQEAGGRSAALKEGALAGLEAAGAALVMNDERSVRAAGAALRSFGATGRRLQERKQRWEALQARDSAHESALEERESSHEAAGQYAEWGRLTSGTGGSGPSAQASVRGALQHLESQHGREAVQQAAPAVAEAIGGAVQARVGGAGGLPALARQMGYSSPGDFVGAEVEQAMARQGVASAAQQPAYGLTPQLQAATGNRPEWSAKPSYYDFRKGAEIAERVGSPQSAMAYGQLYHGLRVSPGGGQETAESLLGAASEVQALRTQPNWSGIPESAFVSRVDGLMASRNLHTSDLALVKANEWLHHADAHRGLGDAGYEPAAQVGNTARQTAQPTLSPGEGTAGDWSGAADD